MHAPIERKAVGIQREPQRLRFQLPEIVQGERRQADDDRAIAAWMRAQLMPVLDRSIAAIIGDKQLRKTKRPIGLRGKYYPDYRPPDIAKRFVVHPPKRWAWRMWPMRYENGRIVVNVPEPSSEREGASYPPIMRCWTIERFPERRPPQRHFWYSDGERIWTSVPWLMRDPPWCSPFPQRCEPYLAVLGRTKVGFQLLRYWSYRWVGDGEPVELVKHLVPQSTYVPYRRMRPTRVSLAEEPDDDWFADVHRSNEDRDLGHKVDIGGTTDDVAYVKQSNPELALDMATRYAWQVPRDIPYSRALDSDREKAWQAWFDCSSWFRSIKPYARRPGRPPKGESRSGLIIDWEDVLQLLIAARQLKRLGYPKEERHKRLAVERKTSPAQVKRHLDAILRQLKAALASPDIRNRK